MAYLEYNEIPVWWHRGDYGDQNVEQAMSYSAIQHMRNKVYSGNSVAMSILPNGKKEVLFLTEKYFDGYNNRPILKDDITEYTFRFGYQDGHPCIFVTFSQIHPDLKDLSEPILCLEIENNIKGKDYKHWHCLNVFAKGGIDKSKENITYFYMKNIEINVEYCIFIIARRYVYHHSIYHYPFRKLIDNEIDDYELIDFPDDWEMRLKIRPTIRYNGGEFYTKFNKSVHHFISVKYPITSEKEI